MASLWHLQPTCIKWSVFSNSVDRALDTYSNCDVLLAGYFYAEKNEPLTVSTW